MHFTTQDGYTFSSRAICDGYDSRWVDAQVTINRETMDETLHVLTLPLTSWGWIHPADARKIDDLLGAGSADILARANARRLAWGDDYIDTELPDFEQTGHSYSMSFTCEDLSFAHMCDGIEPFLGTFATDDLHEYAWTDEADNGDLIVHWDLNRCDGSDIVAHHYPDFDCESEAIFDECDGTLSATYKRLDQETILINRLFGAIATVIERMTTGGEL